jgi:SAM-dependent methyltransferase
LELSKAIRPEFLVNLAKFLRRHNDHLARIGALELKLQVAMRRIGELESRSQAAGATPATVHPFEVSRTLGNRDWYELLLESCDAGPGNYGLPGFPPENLQKGTVGASGREAISHVWGYYSLIHEYAAKLEHPITPDKRLLDFGVAWGRIYRFFLKDFAPGNLTGIDIDPAFIALCKELMPYGSFELNQGHPPLSFEDRSFDFVTAYSVFSHLSAEVATAWVDEFARVLRPGGVMFLTVLGEQHLEGFLTNYKAAAKDDPEMPALTIQDCRRMYQEGRYLYSPTGGGGVRTKDIYGWAAIGRKYVEAHWCEKFELIDLVANPRICRQNVLVVRRR